MSHIGVVIRVLRNEHSLTGEQLAKRAGVSPTTISSIENGADFRRPTLKKIALALGVTEADLYALESEQRVRLRTAIVSQLDDHKAVAGATEPQYAAPSSPRAELDIEGGTDMAGSPEWLELRTCFDRLSSRARSELLRQAHILAAEAHTAEPPNQHRGGLEAHQRKKTGRR